MHRHGLFIDGQWRESRAYFPSINPATEEPFAEFAAASAEDVAAAVTAARTAFDWRPQQRAPQAS